MTTRKFFRSRAARLVAVLVVLAVFATPASVLASQPAQTYPPQGEMVWQVWLNQFVDVVDPAPNLECWDTPEFFYNGVSYFGYRTCFRMVERRRGQWWLEEWRGALGVPMGIERGRPVGALPLAPLARGGHIPI